MSRPEGTPWLTYWFAKRPGAVYSLRARSVRTGRSVRRAYIGQTRRSVDLRASEHQRGSRQYGKRPQPWGACIEGHETMWSSRACSQLRLNWEEAWRIWLYLPVYNVTFNRWRPNPRRVAPFEIQGTGKEVRYAPKRTHTRTARQPGRMVASPARLGRTECRQRHTAGNRRQSHSAGPAGRR